jgi:purine-nucleoside phosphorylase
MLDKIKETALWLKTQAKGFEPKIAIILGSGLGNLEKEINVKLEIAYKDIPNFPVSTVEGHAGKLLFGNFGGKEIVAMSGRFHYYEGYSTKETTFPIYVFYQLGVKVLLASNAAGGLNPGFRIGDLIVITDHINMIPDHPLRGENIPPGPRFLPLGDAYSPRLISLAERIAVKHDFTLRDGIYLADSGPTYETMAEYRMYRLLGADAIGMSTVPEIIVARHCDMECFGISVITNSGYKSALVTHEEVKDTADDVAPRMSLLFKELIENIEI